MLPHGISSQHGTTLEQQSPSSQPTAQTQTEAISAGPASHEWAQYIETRLSKRKCWIEDSLPGWPKLATIQGVSHNGNFVRSFNITSNRLLLSFQSKIWTLERALLERDQTHAAEASDRLKKLPATAKEILEGFRRGDSSYIPRRSSSLTGAKDSSQVDVPMATREGKDSGHNPTPDGNDCIDEVLYLYMSRYFNLTLLVNQIKKLPRASKHDVRALLLQLEGQLDGDALEQMLEDPEDFVTTEPRRVHGPFEPWIYSYVGPMLDFFDRVLPNGSALKQGERIYLSVNLVANILRAVSGLVCLFLLLAPIGVLLLHPMSNANAFGLVCGFAVVIFCLANLLTMTMDQMLLMFCGYIAVMVAFLANLDQTRCIS